MPTAADFQTGKEQLQVVIDDLPTLHSNVIDATSDCGITGGTVEPLIIGVGGLAAIDLNSLLLRCEDLHAELERRRSLCEAYTMEYRAYERRLEQWEAARQAALAGQPQHAIGRRPAPPDPPFAGAKVG